MSRQLELRPELSAQRIDATPNPMLSPAMDAVLELLPTARRAADQGCGKLRHFKLLAKAYEELVLVDTERQLSAVHQLGRYHGSIRDYVGRLRLRGRPRVHLVSVEEFAASALGLDVIFSVATYDVVPRRTRVTMAEVAWKNLRPNGLYVVIVPRNDSTILRRCVGECAYGDGYAFRRNGIATFYRNFRDHSPIIASLQAIGFTCARDFSLYRQVCLVFRRRVSVQGDAARRRAARPTRG